MAGVLDPPMAAYPFIPLLGRRTAERGHPEDDLARLPAKPGVGVAFADGALQPQNGFDQLFPRGVLEPCLGRERRQLPRFPAISTRRFVCRAAARLAPH